MNYEEIVKLKDERDNDPARIAEKEEANLRYEQDRLAEARFELRRLIAHKEEAIDKYQTIAKRAIELAVEAEGADAVLSTEFYYLVTDEANRLEELKKGLWRPKGLLSSAESMKWWEEVADSYAYMHKTGEIAETIRELHGDEYLQMYRFSNEVFRSTIISGELFKYYKQAHEEIIPREEPEEEEPTPTWMQAMGTMIALTIAAAIVMIATL